MAMFENIEKLDKEIERLTETLSTLSPTSEEYKNVRFSLHTLYELRNAVYKVDTEDLQKRDASEAEINQKKDELEVRKQELDAAKERNENEAQQKSEELEFRKQELKARERELALAEKRLEYERQQQAEETDIRTAELEFNLKQHEDEIKSRRSDRVCNYVTTGVNVLAGVLKLGGMCVLSWMVAKRGYEFEQTGTPTSRTFKDEWKNFFDLTKEAFKK